MSSENFPQRVSRFRQILDATATICIIIAAIAVAALSAKIWEQTVPQARVTAEPGLPKEPQSLGSGHRLGSETAKVAVIEYSDFQCPFCGKFARETWPDLKRDYVLPGKVVTEFRHFPLQIHALAKGAATSADCAGVQGQFWEMHDLLFQQARLNDGSFGSLAGTLRLNRAAFDQCVQADANGQFLEYEESARKLGVSATPTFLVGVIQPDKRVKITNILSGAQPYDRFKAILDPLLSNKTN